ncbi:H-hydrate dehydratase [Coprinopsis sp. MPI-PUGE-AT-0042]|nr:H-hydrate dehydratase [Coprinopsis sp. MPI-PUGE-AT-0042]
MPVPRSIIDQIKRIIPPLDGSLHKGQSGRVGVLGGALDYTGAPFFAGFSAMRFGVDLSHIICSPTAAGAIKAYSPDLIVHPILSESTTNDQLKPELEGLLSRLHVLIVGPGLGREPYMQSFAKMAILMARERGMFLVLDADALFLLGHDLSLIKGYRRAVLTPNVVEFKRLSEQVGLDPSSPTGERASLVSRKLGGVTVLEKGAKDTVAVDTTGDEADLAASHLEGQNADEQKTREVVQVDVPGGFKRCGGQGDVLSGCVGTFMAWGKCYEGGAYGDGSVPTSRMPLLAAVAGSMVTRTASLLAYKKRGRSMLTQDVLEETGKAFEECWGSGDAESSRL